VRTQAILAFDALAQVKNAPPVLREPDHLPDPRTVQPLSVL